MNVVAAPLPDGRPRRRRRPARPSRCALPGGDLDMIVGDLPDFGRLDACSLFSPMHDFAGMDAALEAARAAIGGTVRTARRGRGDRAPSTAAPSCAAPDAPPRDDGRSRSRAPSTIALALAGDRVARRARVIRPADRPWPPVRRARRDGGASSRAPAVRPLRARAGRGLGRSGRRRDRRRGVRRPRAPPTRSACSPSAPPKACAPASWAGRGVRTRACRVRRRRRSGTAIAAAAVLARDDRRRTCATSRRFAQRRSGSPRRPTRSALLRRGSPPAPGSAFAAIAGQCAAETALAFGPPDALVRGRRRRRRRGAPGRSRGFRRESLARPDGVPETGAFARFWRGGPACGGAFAARFEARRRDIRETLAALRRAVEGDADPDAVLTGRAGRRERGFGAVECARGRLYHVARIGPDGRIAAYAALAPTDGIFTGVDPMSPRSKARASGTRRGAACRRAARRARRPLRRVPRHGRGLTRCTKCP